MTASHALALAARLCCVARAISLIELALSAREMRPGGILNWSLAGLADFSSQAAFKSRLEGLLSRVPHSVFLALLLLDCVTVAALFWSPRNGALLTASAALLLAQMKRFYMSYDGADEMTLLCLSALSLGRLMRDDNATALFIGSEACLAYLVSGAYKAASPYWKKGVALMLVTGTRLFGDLRIGRSLRRWPKVAEAFEFAVVLWETGFPIVLVAPPKMLFFILGLGLAFHLTCAYVMGLNTFVWAFAATYPCIILTNQLIRQFLGPHLANQLFTGLGVLASCIVSAVTWKRAISGSCQ